MTRVFNFSAGPATLPVDVLQQVQEELLDWQGTGMSVMEMSHRGKAFVSIAEQATETLKALLNVPDNYKILWMQGGATGQFSAIPMNLLRGRDAADYLVTGSWGKKAIKEAGKFCTANTVARPADDRFTQVPDRAEWSLSPDAAYVHYTPNETIEGVEFPDVPDGGDVPLVADFSSTFLSRPIDVSRFGLIYAGAQKNLGPAGVTIVIVRDDLIGDVLPQTPTVLDYAKVADGESMLNTPPCFTWYVCGLVLQWIKQQGGLDAMAARNAAKAGKLYGYVDASGFYQNPVKPEHRSWMNVPFTLADANLDASFLEGAAAAGLTTLKGHRSVGGMRASLYNAMPEAGVDALIKYMDDFAKNNG